MTSPTAAPRLGIGELTTRLTRAGIVSPHSTIVEVGRGADNVVFLAQRPGHGPIVIKVRRSRRRARYAIATWASQVLRSMGVPAPEHIWHDDDICVESQIVGTPVDIIAGHPHRERAAVEAGRVLRSVHRLPVVGFGRLEVTAQGVHPTLAAWLTDQCRAPARTGRHTSLGARAVAALRELAPSVRHRPPCLQHGDWVARHVLARDGRVAGVIDLESVRGGDPMADLAGWSLQEPADLTEALFAGYRLADADEDIRLRLVLHRIRIAMALTRFHLASGSRDRARLHTEQIEADLNDLNTWRLNPTPRISPPPPFRAT